MLPGLVAPSAGRVFLLGRRLPGPRVVALAGAMIEEPVFCPWMTGRVSLEVLGATGGGCGRGEAARVLCLAGLADVAARKVKTYSPGMRQRLGIAAAVLGRPPLLIIDEPASGLDPAGIRDIRELLRGLAAEGTTVLLSSHLLAGVGQVLLATAALLAGDLADVERHGLRAAELARTAAGQEGLALALAAAAMSAIAGAGIQPATLATLDEATALIAAGPDPFTETIVRHWRAWLFATLGQLDAAEAEVGLCRAAGGRGTVRGAEVLVPRAEARL